MALQPNSIGAVAAPRPVVDWMTEGEESPRAAGAGRVPVDRVSLSPEALKALGREGAPSQDGQAEAQLGAGQGDGSGAGKGGAKAGWEQGAGEEARPLTAGPQLSETQQRQVDELKARDAKVRAHEAAHKAAGGTVTGAVSYSYRLGPDGRSYAVGGEVPVVAHAGRTPDETIAIARQVRAAALAPADPSAADLAAAAAAMQMEQQAQQQKLRKAASPELVAMTYAGAGLVLQGTVVRAPEQQPFL